MLRNIPNRVTQSQLKRIMDRTSRGEYDFMYLRIGEIQPTSSHFIVLTILQTSQTTASMLALKLVVGFESNLL